jgi:hypothetical protein
MTPVVQWQTVGGADRESVTGVRRHSRLTHRPEKHRDVTE